MARLNTVLGLAKTYEGRCCVEAALHIKVSSGSAAAAACMCVCPYQDKSRACIFQLGKWSRFRVSINSMQPSCVRMRVCTHTHAHTQDPPADSPDNPPPINEEASEVDTSKSASAQKAAKGAPAKGKEAKAGPTAAASTTAAATVFAATASIPKAALMAVPLQALLHLARGVQLAVRGQAWHEALNAVGGIRLYMRKVA
eukprot:34453-Pelagomonas_calceolata.AAC.2